MNYYKGQHAFYCGIDLHAKSMYLCILDHLGTTVLHRNIPTNPTTFLQAIKPFRQDVVVGVECVFLWYWLADLCQRENIPFILGHALYMKAIHGGKAKNDRIDAEKIATIIRGGSFPLAYVYPPDLRSTRDLLRRRMHLMRKRAELLAHIQNSNSQYNLPPFEKKLSYAANRVGIAEHFPDPSLRENMLLDLGLIDFYDKRLTEVELFLTRKAKLHDANSFHLIRSFHGIGKILALVILYEIHDIRRFPTVQDFVSYARLVKCSRESGGKRYGTGGSKIGNAYLKWAFSEAAVLFLRSNEPAKIWLARMQTKHGKGKALSILARKIGQTVYFMLKRKEAFDPKRFLNN